MRDRSPGSPWLFIRRDATHTRPSGPTAIARARLSEEVTTESDPSAPRRTRRLPPSSSISRSPVPSTATPSGLCRRARSLSRLPDASTRVSVPLARSVTRTAPLASTAMPEIVLKPDARISTRASELMPIRFARSARFAEGPWPWSPSTLVIVPTINRAMSASGVCRLEICMRVSRGRRGRAMAEQQHCRYGPHPGVAGS